MIFSDNQNEVLPFENGIVKTTQFGSELVDYGVIDDGYVWDTRIIDTIDNISIDKKRKVFLRTS